MEEVKSREETHLKEEKERARERSETLVHAIIQMPEFSKLDKANGKETVEDFRNDLHHKIERSRSFSSVRDSIHSYGIHKLDEIRARIIKIVNPEVMYAREKEKKFDFAKHELATEEDVKEYAAALQTHYLKLIADNKRIGV